MSGDLPFVVKIGRGEYVQAPKVRVTWREKRRVKATHTFGDVSFNEVDHAGWDRGGLMFQPCGLGTDDTRPIRASGVGLGGGLRRYVESTAAGVKQAVRRIRPQEAERLAAIDAEIEAHEQAIGALRQERREVVTVAWTNGHVVRVAEVAPQGDSARELVR